MKPQPSVRDTDSFNSSVLPAILNEDAFWPSEPRNLEEAGLTETFLEALVCQILLGVGTISGRKIAERVGLPFTIVEPQLAQYRVRQLVTHARSAPLNDFYYSLTENGQRRAQAQQKICSYSGPAPVPLMDYVLSVEAQANHFEPIMKKDLAQAIKDVTYDESWLDLLGPAINSNAVSFCMDLPAMENHLGEMPHRLPKPRHLGPMPSSMMGHHQALRCFLSPPCNPTQLQETAICSS